MVKNPYKTASALVGATLSEQTDADVLTKVLNQRGQRMTDRIASLGIPRQEVTQSVMLVVSALLERMDDLQHDLARTKESLDEMQQLVDVDCLAPIPNRRAFMRRLQWALAMHERYEHPSCVLYFDLNDFKRINDTYGHAAGDAAIKHVAKMLSENLRESDFLARIGGDEFAIILYYANEENARERGRKLVEKIIHTPFNFNGRTLFASTALGVHALRKGDDVETALSAADTSMYVDKRRNKEAAGTDVSA